MIESHRCHQLSANEIDHADNMINFHWLEKRRELTWYELIRSFISKQRSAHLSLHRSFSRSRRERERERQTAGTPRRLIIYDENGKRHEGKKDRQKKEKLRRKEIPYLFQFLSIYLVGRALDILDFSSKNLISLNRRIMRTSKSSFLFSSLSLLLFFSYAVHTYGTRNQGVGFLSLSLPSRSAARKEEKRVEVSHSDAWKNN